MRSAEEQRDYSETIGQQADRRRRVSDTQKELSSLVGVFVTIVTCGEKKPRYL